MIFGFSHGRKPLQALKIETLFYSDDEIYQHLQGAGCTKGYQAVRGWIHDDDVIAPQSRQDLEHIASATGSGVLKELLDQIYDAAQTVRSAHIQAGRVLSMHLKSRIVEALKECEDTIQKLKEFDPALAATLTPKFKKEPTWEKAFSFSLTGDNSIPLNKRGSGIRRLVLFSFFRATTESPLFEGKNIIYAIEEPETSQHPDAQRMIVRTLREMTEKNGCQVIITTHVPGLASLLPIESLRYITNGEGYPEVEVGTTDGVLRRIADTLGVLPDLTPPLMPQHHNVKLVVCVEGPNDVSFLTKISQIAHQEYPDIIDLSLSPAVVVIPLGGGALKEWVNHNK